MSKHPPLDKQQKQIYKWIHSAPLDKNHIFLITGIAGSGKTTLISELSNKKGKFDDVIVSSLAGKAVQVLKDKGVEDAKTIQSFLYGAPRWNIQFKKNGRLKKWAIKKFEKLNTLQVDLNTRKTRLFIFDEASMIIDVIQPSNQSNYTVSTKSLTQLDLISRKIKNSNGPWHLVMVGDRNQLPPPVNRPDKETFSDALSKEYWINQGFEVSQFNLDTSHRINKGSNLSNFINALRTEGKDGAEKYVDGDTVKILNDENVAYENIRKNRVINPLSSYFISATNYGMYKASQQIRRLLHDVRNETEENYPNIVKGDFLTITQNNRLKNIDLFNGDQIEVIEEPDFSKVIKKTVKFFPLELELDEGSTLNERNKAETNKQMIAKAKKENWDKKELAEEKNKIPIYYKESLTEPGFITSETEIERELNFLELKIRYISFDSGPITLTRMFLLNSIFLPGVGNSKAKKLEEFILEQCIQQYLLQQYSLDTDDEKIREELEKKRENDPFVNSLLATWGYAGTCHTSQGSQWDHVVVDFNLSHLWDANWIYTAITRAHKSLTILNFNSFGKSFIAEDKNIIGIDDKPNFMSSTENTEEQVDEALSGETKTPSILKGISNLLKKPKKEGLAFGEKVIQNLDLTWNSEDAIKFIKQREEIAGIEVIPTIEKYIDPPIVKPITGGSMISFTPESQETIRAIDAALILPEPFEVSNNSHTEQQRKKYPRFGMPNTDEEDEILIQLIRTFQDIDIAVILTGRNHNSIGAKWLKFHKEGKVEMPNELYKIYNDYDASRSVQQKERIEEKNEAKSTVSDIVGKSISDKQLKELKEFLNKEENEDDDFTENEAPF